jgi:hypothetical protein
MKNKIALILGSTALAIASTVLMVSAQSASAGEVYSLENIATGLCLDSNDNGNAYTKGCNGGAYQLWNYTSTSHNPPYGKYWNVATGRCLDSNNKEELYTYPCKDGYGGQNWFSRRQ